ncbi:MAG: hypothetical protein KatS3mg118_2292 [Paracoccaceae bacterium]|nr:MAG: hypothetical protein KatS3mg118_2292 [Paracoccaceae bacterium]
MAATRVLGMPADLAGGVVLALAAVLGVVARNAEALAPLYLELLSLPTTVGIGAAQIQKPLILWINDGLMALFFLVVALEIKREMVRGVLSSWGRAALPVYAAGGGMAVPALVFARHRRLRFGRGLGLGDSGGHRHRLRGGGAVAVRLQGPARAEDLPAGAGGGG